MEDCVVKRDWCTVCGRKIPPNSKRRFTCSEACYKKRNVLSKRGKPMPYEDHPSPPREQDMSLSEINAEARKLHMTYGQYVNSIHVKK